jgi:hypothetical protein
MSTIKTWLSRLDVKPSITDDEIADAMQAEIDELRAALQASEKVQQQHAENVLWQAGRICELIDAAQAVIDRWDTPLWKDVPATAVFIGQLRDALEEKS